MFFRMAFERLSVARFVVTFGFTSCALFGPRTASADTVASPPPDSAPRPRGVHFTSNASATYIDQQTSGPGQVGTEAAGFVAGSPLSPNTPYDFFSSAPLVPGNAGIGQVASTALWSLPTLDVRITGAWEDVDGSVTNASYWGENLMPEINPHLGSNAFPYRIAFPTHAGQDDASASRASILSGSISSADGKTQLHAGWLNLAQTDRFVFAQPALTSVNPAIAYAPAESLSSGLTGASTWEPEATALPLNGIDVVKKQGIASVELTNAALPSLPGESARMSMASVVVDHGEGTRFSAQMLHATTSGSSFVTTVPFGANQQFDATPQGLLPTSMLSGQRQTLAGLRGAFHVLPRHQVDAVVEIGRSWYDADPAANPGTERPGGFSHAGLSETRGRATASVDAYRMEPRYAPIILPYGVAENQWSAAFAWPGQWLKSNYQLIDNSVLGVNRQGYRLRYALDGGPLEVHVEYTDLRQIEDETTVTSSEAGFVDGYYLPQLPDAATLGTQKRYALWMAWHPRAGDFVLDVVDDELARPAAPGHATDAVAYQVPQAVLSYGRHLSPAVVASAGLGRYAAKGIFSEPIDIAERLVFLGTQVRESKTSSLLVSVRRTAINGIPTTPAGSSPAFTGTAVIVEERRAF